ALRVYELQLAELQKRLATATRETEALTRIKYTAWKLRIEKERQYFIAHGVTLPQTPRRAREDEMFARLEQRMREEEQRFLAEAARIEQAERYRLQDQRRQDENQAIGQQQHELHLARLEAEKEAAALVARALREDFV
ncbi:MAG: hypothetical protein AB7G62_17910, partial [Magnetospirillum sp.]